MKDGRRGALRSFLPILAPALLAPALRAQTGPAPPKARAEAVREVLHGVEVADPYRWLEDAASPETREWAAAQDAYALKVLRAFPGREALRERVESLLRIETVGLPTEKGGRYFFAKKRPDQEQSVLCARRGLAGAEEVLIDPHPMSPDRTTSVSFLDVSEDARLLAYGIRQGGEDEVEMRLFDVEARKDLGDRLPKARYGSVSIAPDRKAILYSKYDPSVGPRLYRHEVGADPASDPLVFGEGIGPGKGISASLSDDGRRLLIHVSHGSAALKTEVYLQDPAGSGPVRPLVNDLEATFAGRFAGDRIYLRTNWNAPNGRILLVDPAKPAREDWKEVVPAGPRVIQGVAPVAGRLFAQVLEDAVPKVKIFDPEGRPAGEIVPPALGSIGGVSGRWDGKEAFYGFSSFHVPPSVERYDLEKGKSETWWKARVPFEREGIEVRQVAYDSKDGTRIPMFLANKRGSPADGAGAFPTLLTGYGGFNAARAPGWSALAAIWLERGGVYALPCLRGGGEFGEEWHKAGMVEKKQNVFDDFLAAAEWLIAANWAGFDRLAISGGSNGGLLVGAALTQRPELFRAVVCSVPLLDMVRYHKFLVARFWVPEFGSSEDPAQFRNLLAYSPYHRVREGTRYPAVLFVTGASDTRVDPLHARKMCARLQAATASGRPVLLRHDAKTGHSGGKPTARQVEDLVDELSFLFAQLGVPPAGGALVAPAEAGAPRDRR
ncbi:MAG TPA: prolyl oligopeptidase family serine peptidase [Planctomycetota bacterium]|jgi:prolyl oligopeptidase|nr:prolyl oligopeptidase family serine peptidase [Planctomycetota bacterium]